jgi:hypothetical protein
MKRPFVFETIAMVTALLGAFIFVSGLMQFINPEFVNVNAKQDYSPRLNFLIPTLISLAIFGVSWHFNKKAGKIRRELKAVPKKENDV